MVVRSITLVERTTVGITAGRTPRVGGDVNEISSQGVVKGVDSVGGGGGAEQNAVANERGARCSATTAVA